VALFDFLKGFFAPSDNKDGQSITDDFFRLFKYRFKNGRLLIEAMTHRSYIRANGNSIPSNERLEYLGDSVLGLLIAEHLFKTCPDYAEGDLTKTKAMLVNENTLSMLGQKSGLSQFIFLSDDEEKAGGRSRSSIVSDVMEATIGAIYLDGGLPEARKFIKRTIIANISEILADEDQYNYKGELLEYLQGRGDKTPYYEVLSEKGPDHEKLFEVAVYANGEIAGVGIGSSKKEAEQRAAAKALANLKNRESEEPEGQ
jgi:ribonuclease-3